MYITNLIYINGWCCAIAHIQSGQHLPRQRFISKSLKISPIIYRTRYCSCFVLLRDEGTHLYFWHVFYCCRFFFVVAFTTWVDRQFERRCFWRKLKFQRCAWTARHSDSAVAVCKPELVFNYSKNKSLTKFLILKWQLSIELGHNFFQKILLV